MREIVLLDKDAVTVEVHTQLINDLINRERKMDIINHSSIQTTTIISAMNVMVGN